MPTWLSCDGPAITPASALKRLNDQSTMVMLSSGGLGWTFLAWGMPTVPLKDFADCARLGKNQRGEADPTWAGRFGCGAFVQLDYEFPGVAGQAWPLDAYAAWSPEGRCQLRAADAAGLERLRQGLAKPEQACTPAKLVTPLIPAWNTSGHDQRVEKVKRYIAAGDIYQACLTLAFSGRLDHAGSGSDIGLALALDAASPAPYAAFIRAGGRTIISHSPECFLRSDGKNIVSEPIKGTRRRRPGNEDHDRAELMNSAKDRAELAMIIDLVRNDIGRVAVPGSVRVESAGHIMDLPYVHHLVGQVTGVLRDDVSSADILAATFPAGSITGTPKIRAMQIITELEAGPRGPYCGTFGWLGRGNDAELAVAIRTLVIEGDRVRLHAGGAIVNDSDAIDEWEEVCAKAAAMAKVLGVRL